VCCNFSSFFILFWLGRRVTPCSLVGPSRTQTGIGRAGLEQQQGAAHIGCISSVANHILAAKTPILHASHVTLASMLLPCVLQVWTSSKELLMHMHARICASQVHRQMRSHCALWPCCICCANIGTVILFRFQPQAVEQQQAAADAQAGHADISIPTLRCDVAVYVT
jgi:hypothetical protein